MDRVGISHDTRVDHGACELHREGAGGSDGMRGDDMGVGDTSEVSGDTWGSGNTTGGDVDWETGRELVDTDMVGRHGRAEQDEWAEPSGDRVGVSHGTRVQHGVEWEVNEIFSRMMYKLDWLEEPKTQRARTVYPNRYESEGQQFWRLIYSSSAKATTSTVRGSYVQ